MVDAHGLEKTSGGGYYFHFSPTEVVIAAGIYMPEREQLLAIRIQLLEQHAELRRLLSGKKLRKVMDLDMDRAALTRPPKGFAADHPGIDLIKQQQWGMLARLPAGSGAQQRTGERDRDALPSGGADRGFPEPSFRAGCGEEKAIYLQADVDGCLRGGLDFATLQTGKCVQAARARVSRDEPNNDRKVA